MPGGLPAEMSSFVGREEEILRGAALLAETRILTLTGVGGCGKTRLALRIARQVRHRFSTGIWWVELAALTDESLVADAVAGVVGVRVPPDGDAVEAVARHLGSGPALLVLDNCEHLVAGAAAFADRLLRSNPAVTILATSREPLAIEGEVSWKVPSMRLPPVDGAGEILEEYDAVRLFLDRAIQSKPDFQVTNDTAPAIARICQRLDGIPLAIELAAARIRVLPPESIATGLDGRFRLLSGHRRGAVPRHQTLLASVDWSHSLLGPEERILLRRLGVFAGGFTMDAASAVASGGPLGEDHVVDVVIRLVEKSLVQVDEVSPSSGRYRLLETIRQYALDRLEESGEAEVLRDRHVEWALRLAESLESATTDAHPDALEQLETEHANLSAALDWADRGARHGEAVRLVAALAFFWAQRGHYREAGTWEERMLGGTGPGGDGPVARARWGCGYIRFYGGDAIGAYERAATALEEARLAGDDSTAARCLHTMSTALISTDPAACREGLEGAITLARRTGDEWCLADALQITAYAYLAEGDHRSADRLLMEAFEICDRRRNDFQRAWHHGGLGWACALRSQLDQAETEARLAIGLARRVGDPALELWACALLGMALMAAGRPQDLAPEVELLRAAKQERGALADFIPALGAVSRICDDPGGAARDLEATGSGLVAMADLVDGSHFLGDGARAALEAGRPTEAARLAEMAEEAAPTDLYRSLARLQAGVAASEAGDPRAADLLHDVLVRLTGADVLIGVPLALETLGVLALAGGQAVEGVRLLAAADAARGQTGQTRLPGEQDRFDAHMRAGRDLLGQQWAATWEEGGKLSLEEAVAYARRARGTRKRPLSGWDSLTPVERQVVELTAEGLTNPDIAKRLLMGRGTVKTHLSHIFTKLDVTTRAELASLAARRATSTSRSSATRADPPGSSARGAE